MENHSSVFESYFDKTHTEKAKVENSDIIEEDRQIMTFSAFLPVKKDWKTKIKTKIKGFQRTHGTQIMDLICQIAVRADESNKSITEKLMDIDDFPYSIDSGVVPEVFIVISFRIPTTPNYQKFKIAISALVKIISECCDGITQITLNDTHIMKFILNPEPVKESLADEFKNMYANMRDVEIPETKGTQTVKYNRGRVRLSPSSPKKINEFMIGDYLYATVDGDLTSDDGDGLNSKIALCVSTTDMRPEDTKKNSAKFISLRHLSVIDPDNGEFGKSINTKIAWGCSVPLSMYRGVFSKTAENTKELDEAGERNTDEAYEYLSTNGVDENWQTGFLRNSSADGYLPIFSALWRYHTFGTKCGDWYLPSLNEWKKTFFITSVDHENGMKLWDLLHYTHRIPRGIQSVWTSTACEDNNTMAFNCNMKEHKKKWGYGIPFLRVHGEI